MIRLHFISGTGTRTRGFLALVCVIAAFCAVFFGARVLDANGEAMDFDVAGGTASKTLRELARQAGVPFVASPGLNLEFETPAVRGRLTSIEAFNELLSGSDLRVIKHESGTYLLQKTARAKNGNQKGDAK